MNEKLGLKWGRKELYVGKILWKGTLKQENNSTLQETNGLGLLFLQTTVRC